MKNVPDISLILPCYNERDVFAESVARIVDVLQTSRLRYEIVFVDDGSADGTQKRIQHACKKYAFCRAIFHEVNQGRGKAVADGIMAAKGNVVGYIDIDCEVSPVYMPRMVHLIRNKKTDVAIGKRIYRTRAASLVREVLSRGYQWLSDKMIGTAGLDTETGYKFFNRVKIIPIMGKIDHPGWFWDTEIMVRSQRAGLKIIEVPVLFIRRFDKQSSVHILGDTWDYFVSLLRLRRKLIRPMNWYMKEL